MLPAQNGDHHMVLYLFMFLESDSSTWICSLSILECTVFLLQPFCSVLSDFSADRVKLHEQRAVLLLLHRKYFCTQCHSALLVRIDSVLYINVLHCI